MGTSEFVETSSASVEAERQEYEWLLTSGVLGRSGNLARVLKYVCEEHFNGRAEHIKEYTIAVEALGRRSAFDPQTDTIVRVTVHALRKRLLEVYQNEGANHPVRLVLPPGHYAPFFLHHPPVEHIEAVATDFQPTALTEQQTLEQTSPETVQQEHDSPLRNLWTSRAGLLIVLLFAPASLIAGLAVREWRKERLAHSPNSAGLPAAQATIHALMGTDRKPYTDHSGNVWATANYCQGGTNINVPPQPIEGTEDAPLYLGGVRGIAHCVFPVTQGLYELHFHFAETSDLPAATRTASLSINAAPSLAMDVVTDAGGHSIATTKIVTGVAPENDGSIHIDFISEVSLFNAVEILPSPTATQLPVRIVAGTNSYSDENKQLWESDRYFSGGRHGLPPKGGSSNELGLYQSDRIGRFRYDIPAVPNARYRVKLYFREPWYGKENGGNGGPGSRIFDVACNGVLLMKNFDILAEGNSKPIVKTFENIQATAYGRIELYFMPVVNYPVVSAIEVEPES